MNKTEGNAADVAEKSKLQDSRSLDAWWWSGTVLFFPRLGPAWPIRGFSLSLSSPSLSSSLLFLSPSSSSSSSFLPHSSPLSFSYPRPFLSPSLFISSLFFSHSLVFLVVLFFLPLCLPSLFLFCAYFYYYHASCLRNSSSSPLSRGPLLSHLVFVFFFFIINALFFLPRCDSWLFQPPTLIASPSSTHRCFPTVARAIDIDVFDPLQFRSSILVPFAWKA